MNKGDRQVTEMHKQALAAEIKALLEHGVERVTVEEFYRRYDAAGFRFEHSYTIRQFARYISGPRAGELSPCAGLYPIHKATGLSAFHVDLPRDEYAKLKAIRSTFFAVSRGYILEV